MIRTFLCSVSLLALCIGSLVASEEKKAASEKKHQEKAETKGSAREERRRPSDVVFLLIEMSATDKESREELQRIYDTLRKLDANNDGKLGAKELQAARQQLIEDRVDHVFEQLDADKDGRISREEAKGRLKERFDQIDTNGDGYVSREELVNAISARVQEKAAEHKEKENHKKPASPPEDR